MDRHRLDNIVNYNAWCLYEVLAFGLTNVPQSGRGHGHVTSLNFGK